VFPFDLGAHPFEFGTFLFEFGTLPLDLATQVGKFLLDALLNTQVVLARLVGVLAAAKNRVKMADSQTAGTVDRGAR
jgi:hypothetical protein